MECTDSNVSIDKTSKNKVSAVGANSLYIRKPCTIFFYEKVVKWCYYIYCRDCIEEKEELVNRRFGQIFRWIHQSYIELVSPPVFYPSATSRIIISENPTAKKTVPILEYSPADISGMSSSTTTWSMAPAAKLRR